MDYNQTTPVTLEFDKCNMTKCHCIPIVNDDVPESNEMFYITLEGTGDMDRDKMLLEPVNGTIHILDDEDRSTLACKQVLSIFLYHIYMIELYYSPGCSI